MWKWFKNQTSTVKGMIILCIILVIGIIVRWDYISKEISESFGGRFQRQQQEQTETTVIPESNENTDN